MVLSSWIPQYFDNSENRLLSNSLPWLWRIFPGRPYLSIKSLYNRYTVILQSYLLLGMLGRTLRNGWLTLTNTVSHHFMCQDAKSINQLTLMVLLKKMTACM